MPDRSFGPFHCLECDEALLYRQSRRARTHFAHRPDSKCTGETALHLYAKALLSKVREFTFKPLVLSQSGLQEVVFEGGRFTLDAVTIEADQFTFRPDATVIVANQAFAIEFKVSHAVNEEKQAKVAVTPLPMIEVDLNSIRSGQLDADELDEAILHGAERAWVHHPERADRQRRLDQRVVAQKEERGRRLRYHIEKKVRLPFDREAHQEALRSVEDAGFLDFIGVPVDCAHWFGVGLPVWQAALLEAYIVGPSLQNTPGSRLKIRGDWPDYRALANRLPPTMIRTDLSPYRSKTLEAAGYTAATFGNPDHAVHYYLAHLCGEPGLLFWDNDEESFCIEPEVHGRIYRRQELRQKLTRILQAASAPNAGDVVERWLHKFNAGGQSPAALAAEGGEPYFLLQERVDKLLRMAEARYESYLVDDFCGLRLQPLYDQCLAEKLGREAEIARKLAEAAADRQQILCVMAEDGLGDEARAWLDGPADKGGICLRDWASESDQNLAASRSELRRAINARNARLAGARALADLRKQLADAVVASTTDRQWADLFLKSWQDRCDSPAALRDILVILKKSRR
ncbi:MAG: hypothetical protein AB7G24_05655 [Novosphingobium sp.]